MAGESRQGAGAKAVTAALMLSVAAGFVDAFTYLMLGKVYVGNMSGNSVVMAVYAATGASDVVLHAIPLAAFVGGLLCGGVVVELAALRRRRRGLGLTLLAEAVLLALLIGVLLAEPGPIPQPIAYIAVAIAAFAMGLQNTSLRMAGILTQFTTHVTGTLTKFAEHLVACLFAGHAARDPRGRPGASERREALICAGLWSSFVIGALVAAAMAPDRRTPGLVLPLAIVLAVALVDLVRPFAPAAQKA